MRQRETPFADFLRDEAVGGVVLVAATVLALVCANTPLHGTYDALRAARVPLAHLDVAHLVGEGLLAVFFFVAGMELRRELATGELAGRRRAALPVVAALCGMAVPALVFLAIAGPGRGWAVPVTTDIAFALGVLALARAPYPPSLRSVLLGLAVVDDLGGIVLIVLLFTHHLAVLPLLGAVASAGAYALLPRRVSTHVALAAATWVLVHAAGVHATVAGIALGLLTPPAPRLEHRLHVWSARVVVPVFAFVAAGVPLRGLGTALTTRLGIAIVVARVAGKPIGIAGGTALATRLRLARRPPGLTAYDTLCMGALGGVGFTISLLVADVAFTGARAEQVKAAVIVAAVLAGAVSVLLLRRPRGTSRPARPTAPRRSPR